MFKATQAVCTAVTTAMSKLTCKQAAEVIGVTVSQVRHLCRTGKLRSRIKKNGIFGGSYEITMKDAAAYRDAPRNKGGWKKGRKRR